MKIFRLKESYIISFKTTHSSFEVEEYVDENNKSYFYVANGAGCDNDLVPSISMSPSFRPMSEVSSFLEVQARIIQDEIRFRYRGSWQGECLMRELGEKNLPLLINFFTDMDAKETFEKVLKNG